MSKASTTFCCIRVLAVPPPPPQENWSTFRRVHPHFFAWRRYSKNKNTVTSQKFEIDKVTQEVQAGNLGGGVDYSDATKIAFKSSGGYKNLRKVLKLGAAIAGGKDNFESFFVDYALAKDKKKVLRNLLPQYLCVNLKTHVISN